MSRRAINKYAGKRIIWLSNYHEILTLPPKFDYVQVCRKGHICAAESEPPACRKCWEDSREEALKKQNQL